ncbi:hypothetical protein D3C84_1122720 [compost metagenome]
MRPDDLIHLRRIVHIRVAGAVLEAHQVTSRSALRIGATRTLKTFLRPAERRLAARNARKVADRAERHLHIVRASLHPYVSAYPFRTKRVASERRQISELNRLTVC